MNKKIQLSVCIPTFNREKYLEKLLDSIISQDDFSNKIEIIIYDDPSSDNTEWMVAKYIKKYDNIYYYRNIIRIGMMPSIMKSILKCNGEYIWLFGSDDIMWPNWLNSILSIINKESPDLILSNYWSSKNINYENTWLKYSKYSYVEDFCNNLWNQQSNIDSIKTFDHVISYFSYMSIYCFRRDIFKLSYDVIVAEKNNNIDIMNHYFNYIYILLSYRNLQNICLSNNPTLTYNGSGWEDWWTFKYQIIRDMKSLLHMLSCHYDLSRKTNNIFNRIVFTRYKWYFINKAIKYFKKISKYLGI